MFVNKMKEVIHAGFQNIIIEDILDKVLLDFENVEGCGLYDDKRKEKEIDSYGQCETFGNHSRFEGNASV